MQVRQIGNDTVGRVAVGAIGLGGLALCQPESKPEDQVIATVRAALDSGVSLIDTADVYGPWSAGVAAHGYNEWQLAKALDVIGAKGDVLLATKVGIVRTPEGFANDSSPGYLLAAVDASLRRLGVESIDLYQHHRPDPNVPYVDAMGSMKEIFDSGKAKMIGISNVNCDQIRLSRDILETALVSVQNSFSPADISSQLELDLCIELGLAFIPYSPLGGLGRSERLGIDYPALAEMSAELGESPQRIVLAWELAQSDAVIPIPSASRPESITDSAGASDLVLTAGQLSRLRQAWIDA